MEKVQSPCYNTGIQEYIKFMKLIFFLFLSDINCQHYHNEENTNNNHNIQPESIIVHQTNTDQGHQERVSHITISKEIPIYQPVPIPVQIDKVIQQPVHIRVPVLVDKPYHVKIYKPYIVPVYKDVPYPVYKEVPIPVKYAVEVPYEVRVPVLVPVPYRIEIDEPVKVPIPDVRVIKKGVILEQEERNNNGGDETDIELRSGPNSHDLKPSASDVLTKETKLGNK